MKITSRAYSDMATNGTNRKARSSSRTAQRASDSSGIGHVDISPEARALSEGSLEATAIRENLVAEARADIEDGSLFDDDNFDTAIDRLIADLI